MIESLPYIAIYCLRERTNYQKDFSFLLAVSLKSSPWRSHDPFPLNRGDKAARNFWTWPKNLMPREWISISSNRWLETTLASRKRWCKLLRLGRLRDAENKGANDQIFFPLANHALASTLGQICTTLIFLRICPNDSWSSKVIPKGYRSALLIISIIFNTQVRRKSAAQFPNMAI